MPSRWLCLAILLFWLIIMGPLLVRQASELCEGDNQAPAFTIDLVDEAQRGPPETRWTLTAEKAPKDIFNCRTSVHFNPGEDVFELRILHTGSVREISERSWFARNTFAPVTSAHRMRLSLIEGTHTVSRDGHLLKTCFQARLRQDIPFLFEIRLPWEITCYLEGEVIAGQLFATLKETTLGDETSRTLDPLTLPRQGSIFNPLHPVNRIAGRRLDQRWTVPLVDPVRDVLDRLYHPQSGTAPRMLSAHVLPYADHLEWPKKHFSACLIIEYTLEDRCVARTWIEQNTGLVMKQEALYDNSTWVFLRESAFDVP